MQVLQQQLENPSPATLPALLHALPWLLERFAAALRKHRRLAAADAAVRAEAMAQRVDPNEPSKPAGAVQNAAAFHFAASLLRPLLEALQHSTAPAADGLSQQPPAGSDLVQQALNDSGSAHKRPKKRRTQRTDGTHTEARPPGRPASRDRPPWLWAAVAEGAAGLVAAIRLTGAYQPTEDKSGAHRQLLADLATAVLDRFQLGTPRHAADTTASAPPAGSTAAHGATASAAEGELQGVGDAVAAAQVLGAVMDVEHRALQPQLPDLWALLWAAAAEGKICWHPDMVTHHSSCVIVAPLISGSCVCGC